jgi:carboxymethylenebutenolidase
MSTRVQIPSKSKEPLSGARSEPAGAVRVGGVVVVQEWWGLSDFIKSTCDRLAQAGFVALAPDLYRGATAKSKEEAASMMGALDHKRAVVDIGDGAAFLRADGRCNGRVAVLGFCMGGALALAAAASLDGLAAVVPFYGLPHLPNEALAKIKVPIQAHFATHDDWAKASSAKAIQEAVRGGGGAMDLFVYDAGHAFMRSTDPSVYSESNAQVAWGRAVDFLKQRLSAAPA